MDEQEHRAELVDRKGKLVWVCTCGAESEAEQVENKGTRMWTCNLG